MTQSVPRIVSQHVEEAGFLWGRRRAAARARNYDLGDLEALDERVAAHVDGLVIAGGAGIELAETELGFDSAEDAFTFAVVRRAPAAALQRVLDEGVPRSEAICGVADALVWQPWSRVEPWVAKLCQSQDPAELATGIIAATGHRRAVDEACVRALSSEDHELGLAAIWCIGLQRRHELRARVVHVFQSTQDPELARASLAAGVLLNLPQADALLMQRIASEAGDIEPWWVDFAVRAVLSRSSAARLGPSVVDRIGDAARRLVARGALGDPGEVPSLLAAMEDDELARAAFASFCVITGADYDRDQLAGDPPAGHPRGPSDDPNVDDVGEDPDGDLPWPDVARVRAWWHAHQGRFAAGQRYLVGERISGAVQGPLLLGYQHQRWAAALEAALARPDAALFPVDAPAWRQRRVLGPDPR